MPVILYGVGALTFAVGIAAIGFGIPNNEFGIGNTLIVAGVTACVGGLIVIALGVVVAQLRRIAEALGTRTPVRTSRQFETFEPAAGQPQGGPARVPFPPRPKAEPKSEARPELRPEFRPEAEPAPRDQFAPEPRMIAPEPRMEPPLAPPPPLSFKESAADYFAPHLPNPDEPPVTVADEAYLSPLHPSPPPFFRMPKPVAQRDEPPARRDEPSVHRDEPAADRDKLAGGRGDLAGDRDQLAGDRGPLAGDRDPLSGDRDEHVPPHASFDAMWPAEPKAPEPKVQEPKPAVKPTELSWPEPRRSEPAFGKVAQPAEPPADDDLHEAVTGRQPGEAAEPHEEDEPRTVAILKSGVVDGMGYTLYVDGSIEAELPQGTLRFASINELRSHLEKTS